MKKIQDETKLLYGYTDKYAPKFLLRRTDFRVVLMNLNFTPQDTPQDGDTAKILVFCEVEKSASEIMDVCELKDRNHFREKMLNLLLEQGLLLRTIPDKPTSKLQKYIKKQ